MKKPEDDIAVNRETISALFDPPLSESSFYRKVNAGHIAMAGDLRGYYLLNATRIRNGFPEVNIKNYREAANQENKEEKERLLRHAALLCIDEQIALLLPYVDFPDSLDHDGVKIVQSFIDDLKPAYAAAESDLERLAVFKGWIDGNTSSKYPSSR